MSASIAQLGGLDACAVSDALDALGLPGVLGDVRPVTVPRLVAGRVLTVQLGPATGVRPTRHLCTQAIEAADAGDIIVVAHGGRSDCAGWGGNLSRAAAKHGVAATIVHGAVRDIDESREIGFPVFASCITPFTARGRAQELSWGEPVWLGTLTISTGDYVVADSTGVVFIRAVDLDAVADRARVIARHEAAIAVAIDQGVPIGEVMGVTYETLTSTDNPP